MSEKSACGKSPPSEERLKELRRHSGIATFFIIFPILLVLGGVLASIFLENPGITVGDIFTAPIYTHFQYTFFESVFDFDKIVAEVMSSLIFALIVVGYVIWYERKTSSDND